MVKKDRAYYLANPDTLLLKNPFVRGGEFLGEPSDTQVGINQKVKVEGSQLKMKQITQDEYRCEYDPSLHKILYNKSIPKIAVRIGDTTQVIEELVLTLSLQNQIANIHTEHLTVNPMLFRMYKRKYTEADSDAFIEYKEEWDLRDMEAIKRQVVSTQKTTGDVGLCFRMKDGKMTCKVVGYNDNKVVIPNYDEYGDEISTSIYTTLEDGTEVLDTYDNSMWYRFIKGDKTEGADETSKEWRQIDKGLHGFSINPLIYQRGKVSWELGQSGIEMLELIANLYAVVVKRFGNFAIWIKGNIDEKTFQSDGATLIINDQNADGKGEMRTIEFPKPEGMIDYMDFLVRKISDSCFVTFLNANDLRLGGDPSGTAILLAMKPDIAFANENIVFWSNFCSKMAYLFAEGLGLEQGNITKFTQLKIKAQMSVWTPESDTTKVQNINQLRGLVSDKSLREYSPIKAADEEKRIEEQELKGALENQQQQQQVNNQQTQDGGDNDGN